MTPNEKQELLNKFYAVCPFLEELENFGWESPPSGGEYRLYPEEPNKFAFRHLVINVDTGEHSSYMRKVDQSGPEIGDNYKWVRGTLEQVASVRKIPVDDE